ncbi:EAL domain-containing protein, partial [Oxalobacter sp. OttesenSCG-928-P03]|nr:EAL domain-containing protein [Oxalobacter sp. OttesenSCG-928-P03]
GVFHIRPDEEVDDEILPRHFIERVRRSRMIAIGPMSRMTGVDGKEYSGFAMAVPLMDETRADRIKSILIYHVDPSGFLYPYMEALLLNRQGERTVLLQKEEGGLRVISHQFDATILLDGVNENKHGAQLSKAVLAGKTGLMKGVDVRGEPIIAYVAGIKDSNWLVAQQVDQKEIMQKIQHLAWIVLSATAFFIALTGFLVFLWLRHRHLRYQSDHLKLVLRQQALIQHYDFLSKYANDIILLMDESGIIIEGNDRAEAAYGCSRPDLIGRNIRQLLAPAKLADFEVRWSQLKKEQSLIFETVNLHIDGSVFPVEVSARVIEAEGEWFAQCIIRDITEKKRSEELIWQQANFDPVTGLANRRMFTEVLQLEIRRAARAGLSLALMFLDLDKFKYVNDTLGHAVGDLLLMQVADRLKLCVRETDTVARLGGDEFTVILGGIVDFTSVKRVAKNILAEIAEPFLLDGNSVHVSSSIGITFFPGDAGDVETLLKNADQAMYAAKHDGGNCYHYFTPSMQEALQMRLQLINDLRTALDKNQFEVVYQPIINLASGSLSHAEALIRWHHPVRGAISPAEFIPLAEETGIIQAFSDWVFMEAAKKVKKWRAFVPDFQVGLNISPVQFKSGVIDIHAWFEYLEALDLPPSAITIEITEGLLLNLNDSITHRLLEFRDAGISVALDDFGTGYSSLSYLTRLDIDYVKIDRAFTRNIVHNRDDRVLCEAMTVMAHKLGIQVVAEGVEYQDQVDALVSMGCDYAQGYHVSGALSAEEFELFLQSFPGIAKRLLPVLQPLEHEEDYLQIKK